MPSGYRCCASIGGQTHQLLNLRIIMQEFFPTGEFNHKSARLHW